MLVFTVADRDARCRWWRWPADRRPPAGRGAQHAQAGGQVDGGGGLAHAAFLVGNGVDHARTPPRGRFAARPGRRGKRAGVAATLVKTCSRRRAPGKGVVATGGRARRPSSSRRAETGGLDLGVGVVAAPRDHGAADAPPGARPARAPRGAVRAPSWWPADSVSRSVAARCSERSDTTRTLGIAADARRSHSALRPSLSTSVTAISGPGDRQGQTGEADAAADVDAGGRRGHLRQGESGERVREVAVDRPRRRPVMAVRFWARLGDPVEEIDHRGGGRRASRGTPISGARSIRRAVGSPVSRETRPDAAATPRARR